MTKLDKLYYLFYLLSGKKNNPEVTASCLLSTFLGIVSSLFIFLILFLSKNSSYTKLWLHFRDNRANWGIGIFLIFIVLVIIIIRRYWKRYSEIILYFKESEENSKMVKESIFLGLLSFSLIVLVFICSGTL